MMKRISTTATVLLAIASGCLADERPPGPLDVDEALTRQAASDLVSGAASAYDCDILLRSFRPLGAKDSPVYLVEVQMHGPECDEALLLLQRHGSPKDIVFRRWEPAPDIHEIEPGERGD
jgi:hypothetical protein